MKIESPLIGQLQATIGVGLGGGIDALEAIFPTLEIPLPLQTQNPAFFTDLDLKGVTASVMVHLSINQGASTGPTSSAKVIFDRGVYRLTGYIMSVLKVGPASSSASIKAARATLLNPASSAETDLASTGIVVDTPQTAVFDRVFHFPLAGWSCRFGTFIASGVGQSLGVEGNLYVRKLL